MKIAICSDIHMCQYTSIIRSQGEKYSTRLENCINSVNWFEELSKEKDCKAEIFLGDFFDKPSLDDETITAVRDIKWNELTKYFLVGNHESDVNGLFYSSAKALEGENHFIISEPSVWKYNNDEDEIRFLPYIVERDRKLLNEYFPKGLGKTIIFSHNDIKGIQMGPIVSKEGFDIADIEDSCNLFINGHLHNGTEVSDKIINLGILTGKDLGEDAFRYTHNVMILDTDTLEYELVENPYAFNFYKLDINFEQDIRVLTKIKNNAILSIKCVDYLVDKLREALEYHKDKIVESRVTTFKEITNIEVDKVADFSLDYIEKFIQCCKEKIDNTEVLEKELAEVCK